MRTIKKCLESLRSVKYVCKEIIFIDDGSTDGTREFLASQGDIVLIESKNQGPSRARNLGILTARGEFVAFTDSDCVVHPDWLSELSNGFSSGKSVVSHDFEQRREIAAVGGDQQSPKDESPFGKSIQHFLKRVGFVADYIRKGKKAIAEVRHNPTCNVMYRRDVILRAGMFDESLWPGEDLEADFTLSKKGYTFIYNPSAIVYHYRTRNFAGFIKMMFGYGRAQGVLVRRYGFFRSLHYLALAASLGFLMLYTMILYKTFMGVSLILTLFLSSLLGILLSSKNVSEGFMFFELLSLGALGWMSGFYYGIITKKGLPSRMSNPRTSLRKDPSLASFHHAKDSLSPDLPFISLVLPSWNGKDDTLKCLDSIGSLDYPKDRLEVIITDNGSTDGSADAIKQKFREIGLLNFHNLLLIENKENEGAVAAYNKACAAASKDRDFVFKLDNDIELTPETLHIMLDAFDKDLRTGIVGGEIRSVFIKDMVVHSAGFCVFPLGLFPSVATEKRCECGYVTGCAALIRQKVLDEIGYFLDDRYFVYHDDVDLCLNAARLGWKNVYEPEAVIYHKVGSSTGRTKRSAFAMYYDFRNKLYIVAKHATPVSKFIFFLTLPLNMAYFYHRYRMTKPMFHGLSDFMHGKMGKNPRDMRRG